MQRLDACVLEPQILQAGFGGLHWRFVGGAGLRKCKHRRLDPILQHAEDLALVDHVASIDVEARYDADDGTCDLDHLLRRRMTHKPGSPEVSSKMRRVPCSVSRTDFSLART